MRCVHYVVQYGLGLTYGHFIVHMRTLHVIAVAAIHTSRDIMHLRGPMRLDRLWPSTGTYDRLEGVL